MLRASAAAVSSAAAVAAAYVANERTVEARAARLDRLRDCEVHCTKMRRIPAETKALADFDRPIVVTGLIDEWPARESWSFRGLRQRIGQALVDCGSSTGGVPFYLVAANTERGPGRHDLALYVFDSDFSEESGKACLLDDFAALPSLTRDDVFAAGEAAEHDDRPVWRWLLAGPAGSGTPVHQDPWSCACNHCNEPVKLQRTLCMTCCCAILTDSSWNASLVGVKRWVLVSHSPL